MTHQEQLAALNKAHDLVSQANSILMEPGLGSFSYDEHGQPRTHIYAISDVRQHVVAAMNSINHAANGITDWVNRGNRQA